MSSESQLPSEVAFASFLVYNPSRVRFPSDLSRKSRTVMRAVKSETASWARKQRLGERLAQEVGEEIREEFLGAETTLVPMPGHAPMKDARAHWSARELCEHFVHSGLGAQWLPLLERAHAVAKSSTSNSDARPTAQMHFESLRARADLGAGASITVIDDVITRGATMLAAVGRLKQALPGVHVRGFALIRSMSDEPIRAVKEPVVGTVRVVPWGTKREP